MMDIKDIQEQAFERGRIAGRREAIEERLAVLKGVEPKELVAKAETVLEDLYFCAEGMVCSVCGRNLSHTCRKELMRDAYAVIKALLCGGAVDDAACTGAKDTNVSANCGNCANYDREKGEFTEACGVCKVMRGGAGALPVSPSPTCAEGANVPANGVKEKLVELLGNVYLPMTCGPDTIGEYRIPHTFKKEIADHLIANGVTVQEWISVKDRLPDTNGAYIATACDEGCSQGEGIWYDTVVVVAEYYKGSWSWDENGTEYDLTGIVTHWMPLPEPPEGE